MRTGLLAILFLLGFSGCASVLTVKSDPPQADVFLEDLQSGAKKPLGKTPLEINTKQMVEIIKDSPGNWIPGPGGFYSVVIQHPEHDEIRVLVPAKRFGVLGTEISAKMQPNNSKEQLKLAEKMVQRLFVAQKLAQARDFERAHIELDQIILAAPNFARAHSMRGSIYFLQKRFPESLKAYEAALKADPQMDDAVKMIAKINQTKGVKR